LPTWDLVDLFGFQLDYKGDDDVDDDWKVKRTDFYPISELEDWELEQIAEYAKSYYDIIQAYDGDAEKIAADNPKEYNDLRGKLQYYIDEWGLWHYKTYELVQVLLGIKLDYEDHHDDDHKEEEHWNGEGEFDEEKDDEGKDDDEEKDGEKKVNPITLLEDSELAHAEE